MSESNIRQPRRISDFLLRRNPVLVSGLITAPVAACTDTLERALLLCFCFDVITAITVMLSWWIPRSLPYALRILSYSLLAALVYLPTAMGAVFFFPDCSLGMYLPLLTVSLLLTSKTEELFPRRRPLYTMGVLLCCLLGFDGVVLLMGCLRELLAYGSIYGIVIKQGNLFGAMPVFSEIGMGLILLGCGAALLRWIGGYGRREGASDAAA